MSFFRRERSTSAPRNRDGSQTRLSRSQSFSVPNPKRHNVVQITGGPTENASFHGRTDRQRADEDEQSIDDLNETIHSLQSTLVNHATSNAETMNNLNILQTAHDKLYSEHMSLQEQMDDAVELLKYLKAEKETYENKIEQLNEDLQRQKEMTQESVVSITIENLTKEKMELQASLDSQQEAIERAVTLQSKSDELQQKVDGLEKIQQAYELQTRQTLSSGEKVIALEKENERQADIITQLENQVQQCQIEGEMERDKLNSRLPSLEAQLASRTDEVQLQEREINRLESELKKVKDDVALNHDRSQLKDDEITVLKSEMKELERLLAAKTEQSLRNQFSNIGGDVSGSSGVNQQNAEIQRLTDANDELKRELATTKRELASIDQELIREREEMQSHLDNLQEQLIHYQEDDHHSSQEQQHPSQPSMENPSQKPSHSDEQLLAENEQLTYQIQHLQSQVKNERAKSEHEAQVHGELEMQERLAQRLAVHLKESETTIEARIRKELEEEYKHLMKQQNQLKSKSFNTSEAKIKVPDSSTNAFQKDLEEQLHQQLQQVKEERERWQAEQEEFQNKVLLSKQQLDKIREGYRAKYDKEKKRANDLQKASNDYQVVIEALHKELSATKDEVEELQMQQSEKGVPTQSSNWDWEQEREQFIGREKELLDNLNELEAESRKNDLECQRLKEDKATLTKKCKDIFDEHQSTLQEMEQLNSENQELQTRLEMDVKTSSQYKELEDQLQHIRQSYNEAIQTSQDLSNESAEKLEAAARELESEKKKWNDAHEDAESKRKLAEKERDGLHQKLEDQNEKLRELASTNEEQTQSVQQLMKEMDARHLIYEEEKAAMEHEHHEQLETLNSKDVELKSMGIELKDAVEAVSKLTEELMESKVQQESLKSKIKEWEGQESSFREQQTSSSERIESLEKEKMDLLSSLDDLKEKVLSSGNEKEEITKLDEELAVLRSSLEAANKQIEGQQTSFRELEKSSLERIESLEKEKMDLLSSLDELKEKVLSSGSEKGEISKLDEELVSLRSSPNIDYESQLDSLQTMIEELKWELKTQSETNNEQAATIKSNNDKLELVDKEKTDLREQLQKVNATLEDAVDRSNSLQAEIERLAKVDSTLENNKQAAAASSFEEITRELAETKNELELLQDTNVALEEAVQDIQLEKEDLETENEELATKLGDLTFQAKAMLARNEEMEQEYGELKKKLESVVDQRSDVDNESLREKYDEALEIIEQLKNGESIHRSQSNDDSFKDTSDLNRLEEENIELREVVNHITSENEAAKEIKMIAIELKSKNTELVESLRVLREQFDAATAENNHLREQICVSGDDENRVVPYQENAIQLSSSSSNAELEHYKSVVEHLMNDRAVFTQRLNDLMNINAHVGSAREMSAVIEDLRRENGETGASLALVEASSQPSELGTQLRNLTIENVELAQRLGGAVAEKEFALSTLSKLGAKLEELHERNKMLESIANLKSSHAVEANGLHDSFASSFMTSYDRLLGDEESKPILRDPDGLGESTNESSKLSLLDDNVREEFESRTQKLEPEESIEREIRKDSQESAQDPSSQDNSEMIRIKVPGGEYYGHINETGQKHGYGKMIYDNGNEYEGTWVRNKRDGNGTTNYASGNMYCGAWKEGKRHGFGVFHIKKTGDVYRGNWERGLKHGAGVYEYDDGELDVSIYKEDVRVGEGVRWSASRHNASRLVDGILVGEEGGMPKRDAELLTKKLGFVL